MNIELKNLLKSKRVGKGLRQLEVATEINMSITNYVDLEKNRRSITKLRYEQVLKLKQLLGLTDDEINELVKL